MQSITYTTFKSWKQAKDQVCRDGAKHKALLNQFVTDSIYFFHREGNYQKDILNGVIDAVRAAGLSQRNIVDYLSAIVPHEIDRVKTAHDFKYFFKGRINGRDYMTVEEIAEFIKTNKVWFRYHPEAPPASFNMQRGIATLVKGCFKNNISFDEAQSEFRKAWIEAEVKKDQDKKAVASR